MIKVAAKLAGLTIQDCSTSSSRIFRDIPSSLGNICGYIEAVANAGIIQSTDRSGNRGTLFFRPSVPVSRAEMTKILLIALNQDSSLSPPQFIDVSTSL